MVLKRNHKMLRFLNGNIKFNSHKQAWKMQQYKCTENKNHSKTKQLSQNCQCYHRGTCKIYAHQWTRYTQQHNYHVFLSKGAKIHFYTHSYGKSCEKNKGNKIMQSHEQTKDQSEGKWLQQKNVQINFWINCGSSKIKVCIANSVTGYQPEKKANT